MATSLPPLHSVANRPPRLDHAHYIGLARYFLTICTRSRRPLFQNPHVAELARDQLLRGGEEEHFAVLAYCFMPDHVHLLAEAQAHTSDLLRFARTWKQRSAVCVRAAMDADLWQDGFYDHVLRREEDSLAIAAYIVANPVRAGLVKSVTEYSYSGSSLYSLHELAEISPRRN
jgi:putative transposase